jgi:steroid delta-isomerase-like uncharacterized protein
MSNTNGAETGTPAANKQVVEGFLADVLNGHNGTHVERWWTPDGQFHAGTVGTVSGRENITGLLTAIVTAIPDLHATQHDIIAEDDKVVVRLVVTGTLKGDLIGIPASNSTVTWDAVDVYRLQDGRIAEEWAAEDLTAILRDSGTFKAPWIP